MFLQRPVLAEEESQLPCQLHLRLNLQSLVDKLLLYLVVLNAILARFS